MIRSLLLVGALATGLTPSYFHANPARVVAEPVLPSLPSPIAVASASAAMTGVLSALGEIGELSARDLASRKLGDFRGGARDTIVISTSTIVIILLVVL